MPIALHGCRRQWLRAYSGLQANDPVVQTLPESICFQDASERNRTTGQVVGPGRKRGHTAGQGILCSLPSLLEQRLISGTWKVQT